MKRTFKYRLTNLNKKKADILNKNLEHCCWLYNHLLAEFRSKDKSNQKKPTEYQLIKFVTEIKKEYPFLKEVQSEVLQNVAKRVYKTWKNYEWGKKLGIIKGYPRFKSIHRYNSFFYSQSMSNRKGCGYKINNSSINKRTENRKLKLTLGQQNHHNVYLEVNLKMERNFIGKVKNLTIKRKNEKWYALFSCDGIEVKSLSKINKSVGLDLGIKNLITTSSEEKIKNPKFYKKSEQIIKKAQQSLSKKVKGSQNWKDAKLNLAKKWEKIVNQFKHYSYQQVNKLVKDYDQIAVEDLNVKSMLEKKLSDKKKSLRRDLSGVKFGVLLKIIADKVEETGRQLVRIDPCNTTQTCSNCNSLAEKRLKLSDRTFRCKHCHLELDRDVNSAKNILFKAKRGLTETFLERGEYLLK